MNLKTASAAILLLVFGCGALLAGEPEGFPFQFKNGLVWVKVAAAGSTLNFVLDSGAGSSVLSLQAARRIGTKLGAPVQVQAVNSMANAYRVSRFDGTVGGIKIASNLLALDLSGASGACCQPIDGLVGQDFFRGRIVRIDFKTHRISLMNQAKATVGAVVLPLRYHNDALCVPVGVNGLKAQWTRLDTGCDSALEWAANAGKTKRDGSPTVGLSGGSGRTLYTEVQLGAMRVAGVKTGIHQQPMFPGEAGLLGSGLLSKFCVTIDTRRMQLLLEKL